MKGEKEERGRRICHYVWCLSLYPEGLKVRRSCQGLFNKHSRLLHTWITSVSSDLGLPLEIWKDLLVTLVKRSLEAGIDHLVCVVGVPTFSKDFHKSVLSSHDGIKAISEAFPLCNC